MLVEKRNAKISDEKWELLETIFKDFKGLNSSIERLLEKNGYRVSQSKGSHPTLILF